MRRLLALSVLLLVGCAGFTGPRMRDTSLQNVTPRGMPIPQQQDRANAYLSYPNIRPGMGPRTWMEIPEEQYGQRSQ